MTWKQALRALSDPDGFLEAADPFYGPDSTHETVSFITATSFVALVVWAAFVVPLTTQNVGVLIGVGVLATLALYQGLQRRRRRLARTRAVAELRARLSNNDIGPS